MFEIQTLNSLVVALGTEGDLGILIDIGRLALGADDVDAHEVVVAQAGVNDHAVLLEGTAVLGVQNIQVFLTFRAQRVGGVSTVAVRNNTDGGTGLHGEGNGTGHLILAAVHAEAAAQRDLAVAHHGLIAGHGGEVQIGIFHDLGCGIGVHIADGNSNSLAAVGEYNAVIALCGGIDRVGVDGVVGHGDDGSVRVAGLHHSTLKGKGVAHVIGNIHAGDLQLGQSGSIGSGLVGIDDDAIEIEVTGGEKGNLGLLGIVLGEHGGIGGCHTVQSEEVVAGIGFYGDFASRGNGEADEGTLLHVEGVCVLIPCHSAVFGADQQAVPFQRSSGGNGGGGVEGMGITVTGSLVEVVISAVIHNDLGHLGTPGIQPGDITVDAAEDGIDIGVESGLLMGDHAHTCHGHVDGTGAGIAAFHELNGGSGRLNAVHGQISLVLAVGGAVAHSGHMTADSGIDDGNGGVSAPGTANGGSAHCHTVICGELALIEDGAVGDGIGCALVGALKGGDVACSTLIVLHGVDHVDGAVLEQSGVVGTEDEVGIAGNEDILKVLAAGKQLQSILNAQQLGVTHDEAVCLNQQSKAALDAQACGIHALLGVPVVGDGNALDGHAVGAVTDGNGLGGVGDLREAARILNAVERVPFDGDLIRANTHNVEVGDGDLQLLGVEACLDHHELSHGIGSSLQEVQRLLHGGEHIVAVLHSADGAAVGSIDLYLIDILHDGRIGIHHVDLKGGADAFTAVDIADGQSLAACGIKRIAGMGELPTHTEVLDFTAKSAAHGNGEAVQIQSVADAVDLTEAVVDIQTVGEGGQSALHGHIGAEDHLGGKVNVDINGNRLVILVDQSQRISTGCGQIDQRFIHGDVLHGERLGLAVCEHCIQTQLGQIQLLAAEVIHDAGGNHLKAALLCLLHNAGEGDGEDVLSAAVLAAGDDPLALGDIHSNTDDGAAAVGTCKLKVIHSAVGSGHSDELGGCTAGTVLNQEGEGTGAGRKHLDHIGVGTDLNGLLVLNALKGLGAVADGGAGGNGKHTVDGILIQSHGLQIGDVEVVGDALHVLGKDITAANITLHIAVCVSTGGQALGAIGAVVRVLCDLVVAHLSTAVLALMIAVVIGTLVQHSLAEIALMILIPVGALAQSGGADIALVILVLIGALAQHGSTDVTLVVLVLIGALVQHSAADIALMILILIGTKDIPSTAVVTLMVFVLIGAPGENRTAEVALMVGVAVGALGQHGTANITLVVAVSVGTAGHQSTAKVTFVVAVTVGALGQNGTANITLVVAVSVGTAGHQSTAKVTFVVAVTVGALGQNGTAGVALVILITVRTGGHGGSAGIALTVTVLIGTLGQHSTADLTLMVAVAVSTLGQYSTAGVALVIIVAVGALGQHSTAGVALVVTAVVGTLGQHSTAGVTLVVTVAVGALGQCSTAGIALVVTVAVGTLTDFGLTVVTGMVAILILMRTGSRPGNFQRCFAFVAETVCVCIRVLIAGLAAATGQGNKHKNKHNCNDLCLFHHGDFSFARKILRGHGK